MSNIKDNKLLVNDLMCLPAFKHEISLGEQCVWREALSAVAHSDLLVEGICSTS